MIVAVVGLGYVGLPLAILCAKRGHQVIGFDTSEKVVSHLAAGKSHLPDFFIEMQLTELEDRSNFLATSDASKLEPCSTYLICVPTPVNSDQQPDLDPLRQAINIIAPYLKKGDLVVVESTVFPGTCEDVIAPMIRELTGFECNGELYLAHCPERVNPGDAFWNSENIPRVVGAMDEIGANAASNFYASILNGPVLDVREVRPLLRPKFSVNSEGELLTKHLPLGSVIRMHSIRDAEAVKAMENTVRDVNIAFVNELAKISDVLDLDVTDIIDGMSTKPFGKGPFYPGAGVGGHCIAVDPEWLKAASIKAGYMPELIQLSRNINNGMPYYAVTLLQNALQEVGISLDDAAIAILGVAYKRDVGDTRGSPFYQIKDALIAKGAKISVFDNYTAEENTAGNLLAAVKGCDAIVIVTDHTAMVEELVQLQVERLGVKVLIDGRNCIAPSSLDKSIIYRGIGRMQRNHGESR